MSLYIVMICLFYVPQRKNDQYLEGHTAFLARTGKVTRPVAVTEQLIKLLPQSSFAFPLVCRIIKARCKEYFHSSLGVSVFTLREEFKKHIKPLVSDIPKYGRVRVSIKAKGPGGGSKMYLARPRFPVLFSTRGFLGQVFPGHPGTLTCSFSLDG